MIYRDKELFILDTKDTTYCFRIMPSGHLEHLYYGPRSLKNANSLEEIKLLIPRNIRDLD